MDGEPVRLMALVNTAIGATVGILTLTGVFSAELGGALAVALAAWVAVGGELVRMRTTPWPVGAPPPEPPVGD